MKTQNRNKQNKNGVFREKKFNLKKKKKKKALQFLFLFVIPRKFKIF